jgi:delta1-piperideine-2-carboxylate reductase
MSYGKRIDYLEKGKELPKGSFVTSDDDDKTTSVVYEIADSLEQVALPFGGFKGASVAVIIEILSGLLSGGHSGADTESFDKDGLFLGPSHFVLAIAPQKFGLVKFEENIQRYIEGIRRGEDIRLPGDRAEKEMACRRSLGIPIQDPVVNEIESWATELDVGVTW